MHKTCLVWTFWILVNNLYFELDSLFDYLFYLLVNSLLKIEVWKKFWISKLFFSVMYCSCFSNCLFVFVVLSCSGHVAIVTFQRYTKIIILFSLLLPIGCLEIFWIKKLYFSILHCSCSTNYLICISFPKIKIKIWVHNIAIEFDR